MSDISRNKQHELIMTSIYDALLYISLNEEFSVEHIMEGVYDMSYEEIPSFSKEVVIKGLLHLNEIIEAFQKNMPKRRFDHINNISKAILIMSYTQGKYLKEITAKGVIIDIAVNLAKLYLDENDYKFVNAVLDKTL